MSTPYTTSFDFLLGDWGISGTTLRFKTESEAIAVSNALCEASRPSVSDTRKVLEFTDWLVDRLDCCCERDRDGNVVGHWTNVAGSTAVEDGKCSDCQYRDQWVDLRKYLIEMEDTERSKLLTRISEQQDALMKVTAIATSCFADSIIVGEVKVIDGYAIRASEMAKEEVDRLKSHISKLENRLKNDRQNRIRSIKRNEIISDLLVNE